MRKKKNYRRPDPFALNPEKILASQKKKARAKTKLCEVCKKQEATVHLTICEQPSGVIRKRDLCVPCYAAEEVAKVPKKTGRCMYCGSPANPMGSKSAGGEKQAMCWCAHCMQASMEFLMHRPENKALMAETVAHYQKMQEIPYLKENMRNQELVREFLNRPENTALKAESDHLLQKREKMTKEMEKYVRECAAKRKPRGPDV